MKVYIAAPLSAVPAAVEARDLLIAHGHEVTHDWTRTDAGPLVVPESADLAARIAADDLAGVLAAEAVLVLADTAEAGRGVFVEFGAALALAEVGRMTRVLVVGRPAFSSVSYHHPAARRVPDLTAALAVLAGQSRPD